MGSMPRRGQLLRQHQPPPSPEAKSPVTISPMPSIRPAYSSPTITSFSAFAQRADYSLLEALHADPQASADGQDHRPRQVFSGHFVPVTPTPLPAPRLVAYSRSLFEELGLSESLI